MKRLLIFIYMFFMGVGLLTGTSYGAGEERFIFSDRTVKDKETGLMWTRNANIAGKEMTWDDASKFIEKLNKQKYTGLQCWRLPTKEEFLTLIAYAESQGYNTQINELFSKIGFKNVQANVYWSSTSYTDDTTNAWSVSVSHGGMFVVTKADSHYAWPVCDYEKEKRRAREEEKMKAEKRRKAKEKEEKNEKIKQQQAQRVAKRNQLLLKCDGEILSNKDFILGKNPYADKGKCVEFSAATFQMTSNSTGLFNIGNNELAFIEFKETFRGSGVQGIAKIKGLYNYTTRSGISNQVPHLEMLEIEKVLGR